jgi:hypothetical protein
VDKKLADFADFFHDAGHGTDDVVDVGFPSSFQQVVDKPWHWQD